MCYHIGSDCMRQGIVTLLKNVLKTRFLIAKLSEKIHKSQKSIARGSAVFGKGPVLIIFGYNQLIFLLVFS